MQINLFPITVMQKKKKKVVKHLHKLTSVNADLKLNKMYYSNANGKYL